MDNKDLLLKVNLYFDGELRKSEEPEFFSLLAGSDEGRAYFKQLYTLRSAVSESEEELPFAVEEKIMRSIASAAKKRGFIGWLPSFAYAAAVLLFALSALLFWQMNKYQEQSSVITRQLIQQNRTMELILNNSLPPAEVKSPAEIIIKANL